MTFRTNQKIKVMNPTLEEDLFKEIKDILKEGNEY